MKKICKCMCHFSEILGTYANQDTHCQLCQKIPMTPQIKKEKVDKLKEEFEVLIHWTPEGKKGGMMSGYIPDKGNLLLPDAVWSFIVSALKSVRQEERRKVISHLLKAIPKEKDMFEPGAVQMWRDGYNSAISEVRKTIEEALK